MVGRSRNFGIPKKLEIANFNSSQKIQDFRFLNVMVDGAVSSNPLIVWNNSFGVDNPFTEKPVALFSQAETANCPWVKF